MRTYFFHMEESLKTFCFILCYLFSSILPLSLFCLWSSLCVFYKTDKPETFFLCVCVFFSCFFVVVALKQCYYNRSSFEEWVFFPKAWNYECLPSCFSARVDYWMICVETSCYLCTVTEVVLRLSWYGLKIFISHQVIIHTF